jgi:uncharacterized cofD-like protein
MTGDLPSALDAVSEILEVKGQVLPATLDKSNLCARLSNGQVIVGEANIDKPQHDAGLKIDKVFLEPRAFAYKKTIETILDSQLIVIGPGDLYTSIIPNLLVEGIAQAINQSRAKKVYVCNVMTKNGETNNFTADDFATVIEKYLNGPLDYVIINNKRPAEDLLNSYQNEKSFFVESQSSGGKYRKIFSDLIDEEPLAQENGKTRPLIRHHSEKLARTIMELI